MALLLIFVATIPAVAEAGFSTVVIDAGHGGRDNGASWYGVHEKTIALDVAKRVEKILRSKGVPTAMTRRDDTYVALDDRAAIANRYANSIFVSIHFNAHPNRTIHGIETFYVSPAGKTLANGIQTSIMKKIEGRDRGIKKSSYAVLTRTKAPAVLVECGFISNRTECRKCQTTWYRQTVAEAIAKAILAAR